MKKEQRFCWIFYYESRLQNLAIGSLCSPLALRGLEKFQVQANCVDYLAEFLGEMRKTIFKDTSDKYFIFGNNLNQRDVIEVKKQFPF